MKILFIGDIFGEPGISALEKHLPKLITKEKINFVIAQGENVSGRKGLVKADYDRLKDAGIDAFTMGNHVWAKEEIGEIINHVDIVRPFNIASGYKGKGTRVFTVKGQTIRVSSLLGIGFNELHGNWKEKTAENFFDATDVLLKLPETDFHLIDFHGETTSEKNVMAQYVDGKVTALVGTHTHVQTSDAHILPKGSAYITDVGMTGPVDAAIGADWNSVYQKMRYNARSRFDVSTNPVELNAVIISAHKKLTTITTLKKALR